MRPIFKQRIEIKTHYETTFGTPPLFVNRRSVNESDGVFWAKRIWKPGNQEEKEPRRIQKGKVESKNSWLPDSANAQFDFLLSCFPDSLPKWRLSFASGGDTLVSMPGESVEIPKQVLASIETLDDLYDWLTAQNAGIMAELREARQEDIDGKFTAWNPRHAS